MKSYPEYKDSGVEWLDRVPGHWEVLRLKWAARINPPKSEIMGEVNFQSEATFLPMENVGENGEVDFSLRKTVEYLYNGFTYFRRTDVIVAKITPCFENGKGAMLADMPTELGFGSTEFHVLRPVNVLQRYLFYLTRSNFLKQLGEAAMIGAAGQKRVPTTFLESLMIGLPNIDEQAAIANYLDHKIAQLDATMAQSQSLIRLLQEERAAVINCAVTAGVNPDVPRKASGLELIGDIPIHWETKKLKYVTQKVSSGVTPRGGASVYTTEGIIFLRSQNVHFRGLQLNDVAYISLAIHESMKGSEVQYGDVLLNITGASIGRCCVFSIERVANVNQHVCIIRPTAQMRSEFLNYFLASQAGQVQVFTGEKGISREGLTFEELKAFVLTVPPLEDQDQIIQYLEGKIMHIDHAIAEAERQNALLLEYRAALISDVVTGKIDVRQEVP